MPVFTRSSFPAPQFWPVKGASTADYHPDSFWFYPWGKSVVHKGVDIFQEKGTDVEAATYGMVVYQGTFSRGGNVVLVLGPKWRGPVLQVAGVTCSRFEVLMFEASVEMSSREKHICHNWTLP